MEQGAENKEAQVLAFEWGMRSQKYLYALRVLRSGARIAGLEDPEVHKCLVRLVKEKKAIQNTVVEKVLGEMLAEMLESLPLDKYCEKWVKRNGETSVQSCLSGVEAMAQAVSSVDLEALLKEKLISGGEKWFDGSRQSACDHVTCVEVLEFLEENKKLEKVGESWRALVAKHFRHSEVFSPSASLSNLSL